MDSKRDTILAFVKTRGHATLGEIAAHLEISKQAAIRHLEALEASGLATVARDEAHGPGRPENVYKLTPAAGEHFPDGHRELTGDLVDFMSTEQLEGGASKSENVARYRPAATGRPVDPRKRVPTPRRLELPSMRPSSSATVGKCSGADAFCPACACATAWSNLRME